MKELNQKKKHSANPMSRKGLLPLLVISELIIKVSNPLSR